MLRKQRGKPPLCAAMYVIQLHTVVIRDNVAICERPSEHMAAVQGHQQEAAIIPIAARAEVVDIMFYKCDCIAWLTHCNADASSCLQLTHLKELEFKQLPHPDLQDWLEVLS